MDIRKHPKSMAKLKKQARITAPHSSGGSTERNESELSLSHPEASVRDSPLACVEAGSLGAFVACRLRAHARS